jgi:hypothetical protein
MTTYQDLELQNQERALEFESLLFQVEGMIEQVEEMQKSIISLREYLKGSVFFSANDL